MHINRRIRDVVIPWLLACLPVTVSGQTPVVEECFIDANAPQIPVLQAPISLTRGSGSIDGGGGIDVLRLNGPTTLLPRPENFTSIERFDLRNDVFDTIVVNAETIQSTELGEIEIVSDWFDQIILDPGFSWSRSVDAAFSSQLFRPDGVDFPATVRTSLESFVISSPSLPVQTQEGPVGRYSIAASADPEVSTTQEQPNSVTLSWPDGGFITPDLREIDPATETVILELRNRRPDAIVIDPKVLAGMGPRRVVVQSDPSDRWIMLQADCWRPIVHPDDGVADFVYDAGQPTEIRVINAHPVQVGQQTSVFIQGVVDVPGYRHLSNNSDYTYDAIDLRNGGKDILILRNDRRLRFGLPVFIDGDEGLEEIWTEGTTGWQIQYSDFGVLASTPFGPDDDITVVLAPGLKVALLPKPAFLDDEELLNLPNYPGFHNDVEGGQTILISRAGFVGFSPRQLQDRSTVLLVNGARNVIRVTPEIFADATNDVTIIGDQNLDVILAEGMPEPEVDTPGFVVWLLERDDGEIQTIAAIDFAFIQARLSNQ